jgi:hypothetical protein
MKTATEIDRFMHYTSVFTRWSDRNEAGKRKEFYITPRESYRDSKLMNSLHYNKLITDEVINLKVAVVIN